MSTAQRVKEILLNPKKTWPIIATETTDTTTLYTQYIMILALIPAICSFIGLSLVGTPGGTLVPLFNGVLSMVVSYVLTLLMFYLMAWLVERLAANFSGEKNGVNALQLVAYSGTPSLVGGVFALVPGLWFCGLLTSLYSLYLFFVGVPIMMRSPREKALPYTAFVFVGSLLANTILGIISAILH